MASEIPTGEKVIPVRIEDEMKRSYIDYAMSVIIGRALPDVRDGLKPVHRRILYAMQDMGLVSTRPHKKSARIVGEVLGKYHPHGDTSVYDALVRMVQDFSLRYPLIDGQGNFGSVDGDSAAAMRYTEARLHKISDELLADIDKETVDFVPNFDESLEEPSVLPAKLPNLLLNGSSGIAVGMATNIPPHNLGEVVDATVMLIDNPDAELVELMKAIKGPDFPTAGFILGQKGILDAYETGRGIIRIRARATIEEDGKRTKIIVTELPFQVNKARLIEAIATLVRHKKMEGIHDLRDESDRDGMRFVIELKTNSVPEIVLNQLYKHTQMETTFGVINLSIVDGEPKVLSLKDTISEYIRHRKVVVIRRAQFDLKKAEARAHILEGLRTALDNIDAVIKLIKASKSPDKAQAGLMATFKLTEVQAKAILEMRLQRLTALESEKIDTELAELKKNIEWLKKVLGSDAEIIKIIKEELLELKQKYADERRTEIIEYGGEIGIEDLIAEEDMMVTITATGYIKRLPVSVYRNQRRGGKGIIGMETKDEDAISDIFIASTHDYMLFFSTFGKVYWIKVYEIPQAGRYSKGKAIVNLLPVEEGERITANIPVKEFDEKHFVFMTTKNGTVKKTPLKAFSNPRKGGIRAITLAKGSELVKVELTHGSDEVMLASRYGKAIRFKEADVRQMGRTAAGVRGIRLREKDEVIGMSVLKEDVTLLAVTENGFGKRTSHEDYPLHKRGGKGVINIIPSVRNGPVIGILGVTEENELMMTSAEGVVIRSPVKGISVIGRNTQGVTLMKLAKGDKVAAIAKVIIENDIEND
ncbi:DNA gyrase subunit A [archaeon]|nr:DNA gyrase subunit A [archaeon]